MRLSSVLGFGILLASSALADNYKNQNWAGAVWSQSDKTFYTISGTITIPHVTGEVGDSLKSWIGIDGISCDSATLQAGILSTIGEEGELVHQAVAVWHPNPIVYLPNITITSGGSVNVTVSSNVDGEAASVRVNVLDSPHEAVVAVDPGDQLCRKDAKWIVEIDNFSDSKPLPKFGSVAFDNAMASASSGHVFNPLEATRHNVVQNNRNVTTVEPGDTSAIVMQLYQ